MKFVISLVYDPDYKGYVVDVPQLPGCMTQGKTVEEAITNAKEAIELYLDEEGVEPTTTGADLITAVVDV